jgi:hypothetical protein
VFVLPQFGQIIFLGNKVEKSNLAGAGLIKGDRTVVKAKINAGLRSPLTSSKKSGG